MPQDDDPTDAVRRYLEGCTELAELTTQRGWIDNATLRYRVVAREATAVVVQVEFEEILMEGAGCVAGRVPCSGRLRLALARDGEVAEARVL